MLLGSKPLCVAEGREGHGRSMIGQGEVKLQCILSKVFNQPHKEFGTGASLQSYLKLG